MKYLKLVNVPVLTLIERKAGKSGVEYENYGLSHSLNRQLARQGHITDGSMVSLFPIADISVLNSKLNNLQHKLDTNLIPNDSLAVVDQIEYDNIVVIMGEVAEAKRISQYEDDHREHITTNILLAQLIDEIVVLRANINSTN